MTTIFANAGIVATLLGLPSRAAFLNKRAELEAEHGFPQPMPHSMRPMLWRRAQVDAWIASHGLPAAPAMQAIDPASNVVMMREAATV